jgi:hypothetical protein
LADLEQARPLPISSRSNLVNQISLGFQELNLALLMLPSLAARYQPAVTVMNSIVTAFEQNMRKDEKPAMPGMPTVESRPRVKDMQAINDYYFGNHISVNEMMIRMVERVVGHLNEKLSVGRDGDPDAVKAGNEWRDKAVLGGADVNSEGDFSLPTPGENGVTFRQVAQKIQEMFRGIVRAFAGDRHVVGMAFAQARAGDAHEPSPCPELGFRSRAPT